MVKAAALMVVVYLALVWSVAEAACSRELRWGTQHDDWPPYDFEDAHGQRQGLDRDLIGEILAEARCGYEDWFMPPARLHKLLKSGDIDLMGAASYTEARADYAYFTDPYRSERISLFLLEMLQRRELIRRFSDLIAFPLNLAVPDGGWYGEEYAQVVSHPELQTFFYGTRSDAQKIRMLAVGHVVGFVADHYSGLQALKVAKFDQPVVTQLSLNESPVHLMLSKKSTTLADVDLINQAIRRLQKRGRLQQLAAPYGLPSVH